MENKQIYFFLDIDGVLATTYQFGSKKTHPVHNSYPFDVKCVKVFNKICEAINPIIILSSDWKYHYSIDQMNEIFEWNGIKTKITDFTSSSWGVKFTCLTQLEECRADEILKYVNENQIQNYIAIDDLDLSEWIPDENFVICKRIDEGIKQSGVKEKILKRIN